MLILFSVSIFLAGCIEPKFREVTKGKVMNIYTKHNNDTDDDFVVVEIDKKVTFYINDGNEKENLAEENIKVGDYIVVKEDIVHDDIFSGTGQIYSFKKIQENIKHTILNTSCVFFLFRPKNLVE